MNPVAIVPHYQHIDTLPIVIEALQKHHLAIIVVDDGSGEAYQTDLTRITQFAHLIKLPQNGGKGYAMKHGLQYAQQQGYTHALQIDADAQHNFDDIPKILNAAKSEPSSLICARPIYGDDAPKSRLYGRQITNFWNIIHTWSFDIKDGMCGFRLYPLSITNRILNHEIIGDRMDFDNEILIHIYWHHVPIVWIDTPVHYNDNGISHFRAFKDNILISKMHARLFFGMLFKRLGLKR